MSATGLEAGGGTPNVVQVGRRKFCPALAQGPRFAGSSPAAWRGCAPHRARIPARGHELHDLVAPLAACPGTAASARCTASSKSSPRARWPRRWAVTCSTLPEPTLNGVVTMACVQALCQVAGPCGGVSDNRIRNSSPPQRQIVSVDQVTPSAAVKSLQHQVPCAVAMGVVDALEMVGHASRPGRLPVLLPFRCARCPSVAAAVSQRQ